MPSPPFLIGINMAGAVSAGAYTAGVLDFLIEALDAWYAAKDAGQAVPMHDVSIEVFSGASAGGMCAAIASVMVQGQFDHIHDTSADAPPSANPNRFYESWINKITIQKLLGTEDIGGGGPVVSLLDCSVIDEIAAYALQPGAPLRKPRKYISPSLNLFLTLTNATGIPYRLDPTGPVEEGTLFHTDRLRFQTVPLDPATLGIRPRPKIAKPLPLGQPNQGAWDLLREAAKATGAFPIFLAPRILPREQSDYDVPMWESVNPLHKDHSEPPIRPSWPTGMADPFKTLNMDGGVIDNDPFDLAHDYLASLNSDPEAARNNQNPRSPDEANAAVITVTPFPSTYQFSESEPDRAVTSAVGKLASVLITQSRFFGESLALIMNPFTSSRFMIAPSDDTPSLPKDTPALQCASLGAFGGFFDRQFRAHDFMLGRRNCQWFLRTQFVLPEKNAIIGEGLAALNDRQREIFQVPKDHGKAAATGLTLYPIIPLCTNALQQPIPAPTRRRMGSATLDDIVALIYERGRTVLPALTENIPSFALHAGLSLAEEAIGWFGLGKEELTKVLREGLGDSIAQN